MIKQDVSYERANNKDIVKCHAEALKTLQRDSGAFGTILNDETAYDEISATAGITAGIKMAMSEKILDQTYDEIAIKGLDAVCSAVLDNGEVTMFQQEPLLCRRRRITKPYLLFQPYMGKAWF